MVPSVSRAACLAAAVVVYTCWKAGDAFAAASLPAPHHGSIATHLRAGRVTASAEESASAATAATALSQAALGCAALALCGACRRIGKAAAGVRARLIARRGLQTGIVGLPNVGKSTLFNALCGDGSAESANYPFCTIDPNVAKAVVPDKRLEKLGSMFPSEKVIPEVIEYVDIAGLVKGAAKGEGLGNKFLSNIRETDMYVHMVRCFEDEDITHVDGSVDPARDIETINLELIFADMSVCENRRTKLVKEIRGKVKGAAEEDAALEKILAALEEGKPARSVELTDDQNAAVRKLGLITIKDVLYAGNVQEEDLAEGNKYFEEVERIAAEDGTFAVRVSAAMESELMSMDEEEQAEYLGELGVKESGCGNLVRETYKMLGLRTYYTCGPKESRAWTIRAGWKAPKAASVIHTDFEKNFIKASTVSYDDFIECGGEDAAGKKGKLRMEGKDYTVQDGDVIHFRINK